MTASPSWNPLVCTGTTLAPNLLLAAKLLVLYACLSRGMFWHLEVFLPFVDALDALRDVIPPIWPRMVFLMAAAALFVNRAVRLSSATCGLIILWGIVISRVTYSNSVLMFGCVLLLIGLQQQGQAPWPLRGQVVLVYLGSAVNKLFDLDWRQGQYFEFWTSEILALEPYRVVAGWLPPYTLSIVMSWMVIGIESLLAIGFLLPRRTRVVSIIGLLFHIGMLVFTRGAISWIFLYVMAAAFLGLASWPAGRPQAMAHRPATYFGLAVVFFAVRILL